MTCPKGALITGFHQSAAVGSENNCVFIWLLRGTCVGPSYTLSQAHHARHLPQAGTVWNHRVIRSFWWEKSCKIELTAKSTSEPRHEETHLHETDVQVEENRKLQMRKAC